VCRAVTQIVPSSSLARALACRLTGLASDPAGRSGWRSGRGAHACRAASSRGPVRDAAVPVRRPAGPDLTRASDRSPGLPRASSPASVWRRVHVAGWIGRARDRHVLGRVES
jgi:hypothetical protein